MSVEAGPSGAVVIAGPASLAGSIVNEGPFRGSLEGFRPMNASDINTIDFKGGTVAPSQPAVIAQAETVAAAAWEKSELPTPQEAVSQVEPRVIPVILPIPSTIVEDNAFLAVNPLLEPVAKTGLSPKAETRVLGRVSPGIAPQPLVQEQEVEETVWEKVKEKVKVDEPKESLEEEEEMEKRLFLEDEKALAVRKFEIKQAIKLAKLSTIVGRLVARFLPGEHEGNRSSALRGKGPDGSYEETVEAIAAAGEFDSPEQAEKKFGQIVAENKPIKQGKEGSPVNNEDVARVFKFRAVKPLAAVEIFVKRLVKKQAQVAAGPTAVEAKSETNEIPLEELSSELAEVFQKAA